MTCKWCNKRLPENPRAGSVYSFGYCSYTCQVTYGKRGKDRSFWYGLRCEANKKKLNKGYSWSIGVKI